MGISDLRKDLAAFTKGAKEAVRGKNEEEAVRSIRSTWKRLFHGTLDSESAKGFVKHFRSDRSSTRKQRKGSEASLVKQRGGMAPIAYQMGPGIPSATTNGHYPTDASTDAESKHNMDVYFNSGMSRTAGTESWRFPTVPAEMGSNKVGGRRRTRRSRKQKGGGSLLETIGHVPFLPGAPLTSVQTGYAAYSGQPPAPSSDPTSTAWSYSNIKSVIDPSSITRIDKDINQLVTPTPWK
jgi:hypothetical protein